MQEKVLRDALQAITAYVESGEVDVWDSYGDLLKVVGIADQALASTTGETEMEKLHLMIRALEASERGFSEHYMDEGDYEAARDSNMKANGMGKILDVMAEYFRLRHDGQWIEEEGDADRGD